MKAILQLEQRIMAELSEVQEIQDKLAQSRMVRNMGEVDFKAALMKEEDPYEPNMYKHLADDHCRGIQRTKFQRRNSQVRDKSSKGGYLHSNRHTNEDQAFSPSEYAISNNYEQIQHVEHGKSRPPGSKTPKHKPKPGNSSQSRGVLKPRRENRRWSILDCEDEASYDSTTFNKSHSRQSKVNLKVIPNSTSASKLKIEKLSHSGMNKNRLPDFNKENESSKNLVSPAKRSSRVTASGLKQGSVTSLMDSKKKEKGLVEYSFRPQLSSKSMKIAESLDQSAFERLTTVQDKWKPSTEDIELLQCTFAPDINQKSAEIDQLKNKNAKREERLLGYAEHSKKKIEKLKASDYIRRELEFRNECSFTPAIRSKSPVGQKHSVIERLENWQKKREAHLTKLSQEAKSKDILPSFQPRIEQLRPEIMQGMPESMVRDKFLVEGMAEYLRRQNKAKLKRESSKQAANKHLVLRDYLGY